MNQGGKHENFLGEARSPIDDILYGDGGSCEETKREVQVKRSELELSRNDYRRRYIKKYYYTNAPIGAPERNENVPLLSATITAAAKGQYKSQNYKQKNELALSSNSVEVTVAIPSGNPVKPKSPEMKAAKPEPPPVQEEVKEEAATKVNSLTEANSSAKKGETNLIEGLHELGLSNIALKSVLLLYFKPISRPIPEEAGMVSFLIKRSNTGISKRLYANYELYSFKSKKFLLAAKKKHIIRSAYYSISLRNGDSKRTSEGYIGKLRSNFAINEFNLFGEGENPKSGAEAERVRTQHASAIYCAKEQFGTENENVDILIPKILKDGTYHRWRPMNVPLHIIIERGAYDSVLQKSIPHCSHLADEEVAPLGQK
eukprot:TRINITY_DN10141_c0_g1_i8.p1 TRINITY_DN10141_c0_g1~~TRINITY_DN10141_c0_g1_i8.p1  ORF type:complete len:372 (-),score=59.15 TRINITY_DN10141_c0_g1_i8:243-1358(-)